MSWSPIEQPQNWILLQNRRSPGVAEVSGAALERRIEIRIPYAFGGGFLIYKGLALCPFTVKLKFYEQQDWDIWEEWSPFVMTPPKFRTGLEGGGGSALITDALDIYHPILEMARIRSAVVKKVTMPMLTQDSGEWTVQIDFIEFRGIPKQQMAKATGSKATPTDPIDTYIEQLTDERNAKALAKRP
jgi:hypothetical protein